ncbi:MAG: hypothetical protein JNM36_08320 [Chitinophagales bacterium]|nr:hypothetical protein [Chitinophagales bacterium]
MNKMDIKKLKYDIDQVLYLLAWNVITTAIYYNIGLICQYLITISAICLNGTKTFATVRLSSYNATVLFYLYCSEQTAIFRTTSSLVRKAKRVRDYKGSRRLVLAP